MLKYLVCILLVLLCIWQGFIARGANQFITLFRSFNEEHDLAVLLTYSQPFIWLYLICTALVAFDIFRRKKFLFLNSFVITFALTIGTVLIQFFVIFSAYIPIFEMGVTK